MSSLLGFRNAMVCLSAWLLITTSVPSGICHEVEAAQPTADEVAEAILANARCYGGTIAVVGRPDLAVAKSLARRGSFTVHCLTDTEVRCQQLRHAIEADDVAGRIACETCGDGHLPYTDNSINLLIIDSFPELSETHGLTLSEIERVLVPLGTALIGANVNADANAGQAAEAFEDLMARVGDRRWDAARAEQLDGVWVRVTKPWPDDIDEWSHFLHGADGNPVAQDQVVGPPRHYQWTSGPAWLRSHETDSSISTMVTARGRLFYIEDQAPISLPGNHSLPDKWALVARDAFNGVPLWRVPIRRWGWREWRSTWFSNRPGDFPLNIRKRLVAHGDDVYVTLGYRAPVSRIDAATGEILQTYTGTEGAAELLLIDETLVVAVLTEEGVRIVAVDPYSGHLRWQSDATYRGTTVDYLRWQGRGGVKPPSQIDPALNLAADGNVVALVDGPDVVCLDFHSGQPRWRTPFPSVQEDLKAGGMNSRGDLWAGTMIVRDGVVIHASPYLLAVLSQDTGELLWSQPKKYIGHLWYEWKDVFVIDRLVWTWSAKLDHATIDVGRGQQQRQQWPHSVNGYHIQTGELEKQVDLGAIFRTHHHHRCYRNKATSRYILASRRGTEFVDLVDGQHTVDNWVRGTCHVGMMPANGLQYVPPHPCRCYLDEKLIGFNALASRVSQPQREIADTQRLTQGPAFGQLDHDDRRWQSDPKRDWPAFRHDAQRTGSIASGVPAPLSRRWQRKIGVRLSAPVAVADQLFVALVDQHQVVALDSRDGQQQWSFVTGARVDSPPTYYRGSVVFGSTDGNVYAVQATDGKLIWKFAAARCRRLIGVDGQLESAWPVHGSVLIQDDVAYFAAGRSSQLDGGIYLYAVDAATGRLLHQARLDGPHYTVENVRENYNLPMGTLPDIMVGDGERIFMRSQAFDNQLQRTAGKPDLNPKSGYLEDSYFKRTPWTFRGDDYARLIVHDARSVYYVRMFDSLKGLDPTVFFTPGRQGYLLFAKDQNGRRDSWRCRVPVRIRAMVLAAEQLIVAGPPDVVDPQDPLGAFEGRQGAQLHLFDRTTGELQADYELVAPPVFNGMAVARGRLFVTDEQGQVTCFGQP